MLDRFSRFSFTIADISRYWHKLAADEMEKHGLRGTHAVYLVTMAQAPNGFTAGELSRLCGRDKSDVSRSMTLLAEKGMITKEGGGENRYGGTFFLTERGRAAAAQVEHHATVAAAFAGKDLTDEAREIFYTSLESILENLRKLSEFGFPKASAVPPTDTAKT